MGTTNLNAEGRRIMLGRAATLLAAVGTWRAPAAAAIAHSDAELLEACRRVNEVEARKMALFDGPNRVANEEVRDLLLDALDAEQQPFLDRMCELRAETWVGHRCRAWSIRLWDHHHLCSGGENGGSVDDRLLWSVLRDLTESE